MQSALWVVILLVLLALMFDFINGFHDAANSIATVVSTGVLRPSQAVAFAAFFNFVALFVFQLSVAATVGKGIVEPGVVDVHVVFGALVGAITWNLVTWFFGIPSSSSHALIGGIIWMLLIATGYASAQETHPPYWTIFACYVAIAAGTLFGGWRIVKTMGQKITKLKPVGGFCAEAGGAMTLFLATSLGIPVSTTHTITGAIVGVGSIRRPSAVRWGVAGNIVWAWVLTIPASAFISAAAYVLSLYLYD